MKFHYAGKYSGNPDDLPCLEHEPGAVAFKEAKDAKEMGRISTVLSIALFFAGFILCSIRAHDIFVDYAGLALYILTIIPHEFLHAACFKEDV